TDMLVELARNAGPAHGLYGAKITGGGAGGVVAVLGHAETAEAVRSIMDGYLEYTGSNASVFEGNSQGADVFTN
ncbi:MAG: GHMP kinase, partial [Candidatus Hydrogenedentes bacterium]|nr:GHMP kinase [Candidatus Hydrogenedentota bacterium]